MGGAQRWGFRPRTQTFPKFTVSFLLFTSFICGLRSVRVAPYGTFRPSYYGVQTQHVFVMQAVTYGTKYTVMYSTGIILKWNTKTFTV